MSRTSHPALQLASAGPTFAVMSPFVGVQERVEEESSHLKSRVSDAEQRASEADERRSSVMATLTAAEERNSVLSQELQGFQERLDTAEAAAGELASVKEQLTDVMKDREQAVTGKQQAEQEVKNLVTKAGKQAGLLLTNCKP